MSETLSQDSLRRAADLIMQADALIVTAGVGKVCIHRQCFLRQTNSRRGPTNRSSQSNKYLVAGVSG